ncbi:hypothetical protein CVT24_001247, partial [Panaeolus cyanescens]
MPSFNFSSQASESEGKTEAHYSCSTETSGSSTTSTTSTFTASSSQVQYHDLALAFSQVPWMRFSIVAQPDITQLTSNPAFKVTIDSIISNTHSSVAHDIHKGVSQAVDTVMRDIRVRLDARMKSIHEGMFVELGRNEMKKTATCNQALDVTWFDCLLKDLKADGEDVHTCGPTVKPGEAPSRSDVDAPVLSKPTQPIPSLPPIQFPNPTPPQTPIVNVPVDTTTPIPQPSLPCVEPIPIPQPTKPIAQPIPTTPITVDKPTTPPSLPTTLEPVVQLPTPITPTPQPHTPQPPPSTVTIPF